MRSSLPILLTKIVNIIMSVCISVFGIIVIAMPSIPANTIGLTIGILLILLGVFKLAGNFSKDLFRLAFQYDVQLGALLAVLGAGVLLKSGDSLDFTRLAFSTAIFTDGLFKTSIAFDSKKFGIKPWYAILISSVAACTAGAALILLPLQNVRTVTIVLGISLILEGILHLIVILSTVKIINHQMPDNPFDTGN